MGGVTWEVDMLSGVGIRMLHRLVELFTGDAQAAEVSCFDPDGPIIGAFRCSSNPIVSSVRIIRDIVGAGAETKVMVSVDEVALAPKAGSEYSTSKALRTLAGVMDSDRKGKNIFICIHQWWTGRDYEDVGELCQ
jgi:hypothetical protein